MMDATTQSAAPFDTLTACPMCDGESAVKLPIPGHWIGDGTFAELRGRIGVVRCGDCGLVYTNPRPSQDRLDAYYSGNTYVCHETAGSASGGVKAQFLLDRLERRLSPEAPRTLLDYGAGGGGFMLHARARGWKVQGFEPGRRGRETCRNLGLDVVANCDELPAGGFGLVTLHHVFEHLADPASVLRGIKRLLHPLGRLFIEVPNAGSLRARLALPIVSRHLGVDERYRAFPIHLMYYTDRALRGMLRKGGWDIDATFTIGFGVDEFFTSSRRVPPSGTARARSDSPSERKRVRHMIRDAFLSTGLGENLAAIARPPANLGTTARSEII